MSKSEILERERRWAPWAGAAAFACFVLVVAGNVIATGASPDADATEAETLLSFNEESSTLLLGFILQAIGIGLVAVPLLYLFRATDARSDRVRSTLVGIVVAGPIFYGVFQIALWVGLDTVAGDFVAADPALCTEGDIGEQDDCVTDLISDNSAIAVAQGLQLAGVLGLIVALFYTALNAMRVGLLTRFFGTLGMALGALVLLLGPLGVVLYMPALGFMFINRWPGGRPPAWDAGEAIPWPKPGEEPPEPDRPPEPEIEGSAEEILGRDVQTGNGTGDGDGPAPRKRKRRS